MARITGIRVRVKARTGRFQEFPESRLRIPLPLCARSIYIRTRESRIWDFQYRQIGKRKISRLSDKLFFCAYCNILYIRSLYMKDFGSRQAIYFAVATY